MANGYYLFSCSMVNKAKQSAVAMSAYRSGETIYSLRDGETKRYKERLTEPDSFILKPDHAPEWTLERAKLWNEVEAFEHRDRAQIARNILVALPNNMTHDQQFELTQDYVQENFVDEGMVADVSIHRDELTNPHAHILLTTRPFDHEGHFEKRKSKRVPVLDDDGKQTYNEKGWRVTQSIKLTNWDQRDTLNKWRENWSEKLNEKSLELELGKSYSDKSFKDQGRFEQAEIRLTRNEYQLEKRVKNQAEQKGETYQPKTYYAQKNHDIQHHNKELEDLIHLKAYRQNEDYQAFFNDLRRNRHVDPETVAATRLLVNRVKGYVDYQTSKNLYQDFANERNKWKLKLERDTTINESKKKLYSRLIEKAENNQETVKNFGYSIENFNEEIAKDLQEVQASEQRINSEYEKFNELKQATTISLDYQKYVLNNEFESVYSNVNKNDYSFDEKYFAIQLMKDHTILLPDDQIKSEFKDLAKEQEYNKNYIPVWKQAKDTINSIDIYNRTLKKVRGSDATHLTPEKIKDNVIKISTFETLEKDYKSYLQDISPIINNEIENISSNTTLNNLDMKTKIAVLEDYSKLDKTEQKNLNIEEFVTEVQQQHEQESTYLHDQSQTEDDEETKEIYQELSNQSKAIADGLLDVLNAITQDRDATNARSKKDRTKVFRKRGTDGREL